MADEGDLRVWWIPQVPMPQFWVDVSSPADAKRILSILGDYDAFQLTHRVKPDYCNVGGLCVFEDGEWVDWYDPETGDDIDQWRPE
jgi:hypothetical protein